MPWIDDDEATFRNVGEREIDALMIEELRSSTSFRDWFCSKSIAQLGLERLPDDGCVLHSVHRSGEFDGQTDLLIKFEVTNGDIFELYIENKVASPLSDRTKSGMGQIDRYLGHIEACISRGSITGGRLLVCGPQNWLDSHAVVGNSGVDLISLESMKDWFQARSRTVSGEHAARFQHKALVLQCALVGYRRAYAPKPDERVTEMWTKYYEVSSKEFPDLAFKEKTKAPGPDSYTAYFPCGLRLPSGEKISLAHVIDRGNCDVLFGRSADRLDHFRKVHSRLLEPGMAYRSAKGSLGVNIQVRKSDRFEADTDRTPVFREALTAIRQLKRWIHEHVKELV